MPRARTILNDYSIVVGKSENEQTTRETQIATPIFFAITQLRPLAPFQARPQSMHLFRLNLLRNESHTSIWRSHLLNTKSKDQISQLRQSIPYNRIRIVLFLRTTYPFDWKQSYTALLKNDYNRKIDCMTARLLVLRTVQTLLFHQ